mgnify:CR=1 FL=1
MLLRVWSDVRSALSAPAGQSLDIAIAVYAITITIFPALVQDMRAYEPGSNSLDLLRQFVLELMKVCCVLICWCLLP